MTASILSIGTAVPPARVSQTAARDVFATQPGLAHRPATHPRGLRRVGDRVPQHGPDRSGRAALGGTRRSRTAGRRFGGAGGRSCRPVDGDAQRRLHPASRPPLFAAASAQALTEASACSRRGDARRHGLVHRHVRTRSRLPAGAGPRPARATVERYHIGFMGCAAALPGLRAAARICAAQPDAVVLVAAAELCTLHIRSSEDPQQIVAASVFADGAAAAIVSARPRRRARASSSIGSAPSSRARARRTWSGRSATRASIWSSPPKSPASSGGRSATPSARSSDRSAARPWAVHPGGRSVLDRVETGLELDPAALEASRAVLAGRATCRARRSCSSCAICCTTGHWPSGDRIAALAFGPGLTVESALLTRTR